MERGREQFKTKAFLLLALPIVTLGPGIADPLGKQSLEKSPNLLLAAKLDDLSDLKAFEAAVDGLNTGRRFLYFTDISMDIESLESDHSTYFASQGAGFVKHSKLCPNGGQLLSSILRDDDEIISMPFCPNSFYGRSKIVSLMGLPPFIMNSRSRNPKGSDVDVARIISSKLDFRMEFRPEKSWLIQIGEGRYGGAAESVRRGENPPVQGGPKVTPHLIFRG